MREIKQFAFLEHMDLHPADVRHEICNRLEITRSQLTKMWARCEGIQAMTEILKVRHFEVPDDVDVRTTPESVVNFSSHELSTMKQAIATAQEISKKINKIGKYMKFE